MTKQEAIEIAKLLNSLIEVSAVEKILGTFIKAFKERSIKKDDGIYYLHGNFNLGGTVSGRLSSSDPNLQNLPSGSIYGKAIKKCFKPPKGWLMLGADYASLEDRVSALTTKDPNKLKVYTDNYDGHCLRAYGYFKDQMPDIVNTVKSINSIAKKYPKLRQKSKAPTFLLTYQGTYHGLMHNVGLSEESAKSIENNYHEMYKVSDDWVKEKLAKASKLGYVTCAFGLRVRTPILKNTVLNNKYTPREAKAESRTAGNALGQSYGMLNNLAAIEFQKRVLASKYALYIKPIALIHDALYYIALDVLDCIYWFNKNLAECMAWQELEELKHDQVKLYGESDIFYPNWSNSITLPNKISKKELKQIAIKGKTLYEENLKNVK